MNPALVCEPLAGTLSRAAARYRWLQAPAGILMVLLQRAPALPVVAEAESVIGTYAVEAMKGAFALAALGAVNSVAGATTFNVTATPVPASPTSGGAKATFALTGTTGTAMSIAVTVSGAPGNPKSYSVGTLPAGLSLTGATGSYVNVSAPYKMTITGTPTASGNSSVKVTAWDGSNGSGGNSAYITLAFAISSGVTTVAPAITTQPQSATVTAGGSVTFTAAASGTPAPTYQWYHSAAALVGQTAATLSLSNVQAADAGSYTMTATNAAGSATTAAATLTVNAAAVAPAITTQPASATVTAGTAANFSVTATGTAPLAYQWRKDGTDLAGATSSSYSIASAQAADAGNYSVVVSNSAGSATSGAATLTVNAAQVAPAITTQPQALTVTPGSGATFSVAATGTAPLGYQWRKDGANISGATGASFQIAAATATDAGNYSVVVTNAVGSVTSAAAALTVSAAQVAPSLTTQPAALTVTAGSGATFTVVAAGTSPLTYQWRKDGANISGATGASYQIAAATAADAGNYSVVVTNAVGSVTSASAALVVNAAATAPAISAQPQSVSAGVGSAVTFTVTAGGTGPLAYQWRKDGVNLSGATGASFALASVQVADAGGYSVAVTNAAGTAVSATATLTVTDPPVSTGPVNLAATAQTVSSGHNFSISAVSPGPAGSTYQWQVSTDGGGTWSTVANSSTYAGATTSTLTISDTTGAMSGYRYRLIVTNGGGSVTSDALALTVIASPLPGPFGLAVNPSGNLVVGDSSNNTINLVTPGGAVTVLAGAAGQQGASDGSGSSALFRQPGGLAVDAVGNVYVADTGNSLVRKITPGGMVTTVAGSAANQGYRDGNGTNAWFNSPADLTLDAAGNLYVADTGNSVIRKIAPDGTVTTVAGAPSSRGSTDGAASAARFNQPSGVALDSAGNLYVADTFNQTIRKIAPGGSVTTWVGVPGISGSADGTGAGALFNLPGGLAVDGSGNVYVADAGNASIRLVTPGGTVSTLAGLSTVAGLEDGTAFEAFFNQPKEIKLDGSGNLYVTDNGNAALRKIAAGAVVTTLTLSQVASSSSSGSSGSTSTVTPPTPSSSGSSSSSSAPGKAGAGGLDAWWSVILAAAALFAAGRRRCGSAETRW